MFYNFKVCFKCLVLSQRCCAQVQTLYIMSKMAIKHAHLCLHTGNRPQHISLAYAINHTETPWPFNYSTSHLVHHDLPQGNCIFCLFFFFVFCSTFATNPTNLNWMSAALWSYRAFTYKPFLGLIALSNTICIYIAPFIPNMIWHLCP